MNGLVVILAFMLGGLMMENEILNEMDKMERYQNIVDMLHEFDYIKNGKVKTIEFLAWVLNYLLNGEVE